MLYGLRGQFWEARLKLSETAVLDLYRRHFATTKAALEGKEDLRTLAEIGYQTFVRLLPDEDFREAVAAAIDNSVDFRIEIIGDPYLIPWGLLYTRSPNARFHERHFVGVTARLKRSFLSERYVKPPSPSIAVARPRILFGLNSDLTHARTVEHPFISRLAPASAAFHMLPALKGDVSEGRRKLRELLIAGDADFIHFACHGTGLDEAHCATFTIDKRFKIRSDILFRQGDRLSKIPIVFLNACEMGISRADQYQSLVRPFLDCGARAVIATECNVPDKRAARFACDVYGKLFLERKSLAQAVVEATAFRCAQGDPIGLAYTVYGQADARLLTVAPDPVA
ncbi:CHAT domain-containing protein [Bradyrhizobium sp. SZCCHNR3058]|uniref:CHAT domain-containing protein n=1 Tax=Bradyrhizobium sp. SZCCHNR3058 TaxID=3057423 RepID=UPI0029169E43|nr:CHAT domain-containing protein [Bradyrhizobium sp. SZCCHNR3058]